MREMGKNIADELIVAPEYTDSIYIENDGDEEEADENDRINQD